MWVNTKLIKNFKVFKVNLNSWFNVETLSNGYRYTDIKFIYAYEKVDATSYEWDSTLTLNGSYPNYYFSARENVTSASIINVVIMDGDASDMSTDTSIKNGSWVTTSVIGKMATFKLNKSNGFKVNLDLDLGAGTWTKGKYSIIPMVSKIKFTEYDRGYDLTLTNVNGNTYTCGLKNWRFLGKYVDYSSFNPNYQEVIIRDDCVFATSFQVGGGGSHSVYLKMSVDGNLIYDKKTYETTHGSYTLYKKYGVRQTLAFLGNGSFKHYKYIVRQFLSEYSEVSDYEVTCLVIEELS